MKTITANEMIPFQPTHPGEVLKEELISRGITQKRFASVVGVPYTALNEILNGKRSISTEFALLLEASLGVSADLWINMQARYNLQSARKDKNILNRFEELRKVCASLL